MTALIGESGSGKSSLLDIISGYRSMGFNGIVSMNGQSLDSETLIKCSCYIQQDIILRSLLTTFEAIMFVAHMTFTSTMPRKEKKARISIILEKLMLLHCKNTLTKNLTAGERKRLALALELIPNPCIILLDELISGLDSQSARECLKILRNLSDDGKTVVCSVHQPSMQILQLFDNLYIMWRGRCVYQGSVDNLVPFLKANGFECPRYHNPAEYMIELCVLDGASSGDIFVKTIDNGKSLNWMTKVNKLESSVSLENKNEEDSVSEKPAPISARSSLLYKDPIWHPEISVRPSFTYRFRCMLVRTFFTTIRNPALSWLMILTGVVEGLAFGLFFFNEGGNARWMVFNYNMIFLITVSVLYNNLFSQIINFPLELQLTKREYMNGWYSLTEFWLSYSIASIPIVVLSTIGMGATFYYLVRYPTDGFRVAQFVVLLVGLALVSQDYGTLIGSMFSTQIGLVIGVLSTTSMIAFSGFLIYDRDCKLEPCHWMFKILPLKRILQGTLFSAYGYDRGMLHCDQGSCIFTKPNDFFQFVDMKMNEEIFWSSLTYIGVLHVAVKLVAMTAVKYKCSRGV